MSTVHIINILFNFITYINTFSTMAVEFIILADFFNFSGMKSLLRLNFRRRNSLCPLSNQFFFGYNTIILWKNYLPTKHRNRLIRCTFINLGVYLTSTQGFLISYTVKQHWNKSLLRFFMKEANHIH